MAASRLPLEESLANKTVRKAIASQSHRYFFSYYLSHYVEYAIAPFQEQLFAITENNVTPLTVIAAFRGSAKSTIITTSYAMWAILGVQQKKFVVIVSQTNQQARMHLKNIRRELEANPKLIADYGQLDDESDEWTADTIYLPKFGVRIMAISIDQSLRGMRLGQFRPDLIICDDIEDIDSVKTLENRNTTYQKLIGDIFPMKARGARIIVVGNLLHKDSALQRFHKAIDSEKLAGEYHSFPLLDEEDQIAWLGKYPDAASIEAERRTIGDDITWQREFMLKIVADDYQLIHPDDIQCYTKQDYTAMQPYYLCDIMSVDPASSTDSKADKTAMLSASLFADGDGIKIYLHPYPINQHLEFSGIINTTQEQYRALRGGYGAKVYIENVASQRYITQELERIGIPAEGVNITQDKRVRLAAAAYPLHRGKVLFPEHGADELIGQLLGFGFERYDDLVDAYSLLVNKALEVYRRPFNADQDMSFD